MKKCKFCAEEIQDEAIKCKYCGGNIAEPSPENITHGVVSRKSWSKREWNISPMVFVWLLAVVVLILVFGFWGFIGIALAGVIIWWLWKKSKFDKNKKIIFSSVVAGILVLVFAFNVYSNRAPSIKILSPEDNSSVQAGSIQIQGKVSPSESELTINGKSIETQSGSFTYDFALSNKVEKNDITLKARANSKESTKTLNINRIFTEEEKLAIEKTKKDAELKTQQEREARIAREKAEQEAYYRTPAGKICKAHPEWSKSDCEGVTNRKIWIGMSLDMLKYNLGLPSSASPSNYGSGNHWQWCWREYDSPNCFYGGDDGIITSYN